MYCMDKWRLIVLVLSEPLGPDAWLRSTCKGPVASSVELAMPLECVQLLEINISGRPVQEHVVDLGTVPVDNEVLHFMASTGPLTVKLRRNDAARLGIAILIEGPTPSPHGVSKYRDVVSASNVACLPVPFGRAALNLTLSGPWIENPAVCAIAGLFPPVLHAAASHDVGPVETAVAGHVRQSLDSRRAYQDTHLRPVVRP